MEQSTTLKEAWAKLTDDKLDSEVAGLALNGVTMACNDLERLALNNKQIEGAFGFGLICPPIRIEN